MDIPPDLYSSSFNPLGNPPGETTSILSGYMETVMDEGTSHVL